MAGKYYANNPYETSGSLQTGNSGGFNYSGLVSAAPTISSQGAEAFGSFGDSNYNPIDQYPSINNGSLYLDPRANQIYNHNINSASNIGDRTKSGSATQNTASSALSAVNPAIGALYEAGSQLSDFHTKGDKKYSEYEQAKAAFASPSRATFEAAESGDFEEFAASFLAPVLPGLSGRLRSKRVKKERDKAIQEAKDKYQGYLDNYNSAIQGQSVARNAALTMEDRGQSIPSSFYNIV